MCKTVCPPTINTIRYFNKKEYPISLIFIEKAVRKKFTENEIKFRSVHDKYNIKYKKYNIFRRSIKRIWNIQPNILKNIILKNIYIIPFLNKFSVEKYAKKEGIQVINVNRHSSLYIKNIFEKHNIEYVLLLSSNWLIREPLLSMKNTKIINVHSGYLPKHRGLDSIPWSILQGETIGCTAHSVDKGIDTGLILKCYEDNIVKGDTIGSIMKRILSRKPEIFYDVVTNLKERKIIPIIQSEKHKIHEPMSLEQLELAEQKLQEMIKKKGEVVK